MTTTYHRRPNRLHLLPIILDMVNTRTWFSARQIAHAVYYGRGVPHSQQLIYVRDQLDAYMRDGALIRDDHIAACPLYGFAQGYCFRPKSNLLIHYLYFWPPRWPEDNVVALLAAYNDLDRFIPRRPKTSRYLRNGRLPVPPPLTGPASAYPLQRLPEPDCSWLACNRSWATRCFKWLLWV